MPSHPGTWARRIAFGIDLSKPGVEEGHYVCAGYYSVTQTGFGESVRPRQHVYSTQGFEYSKGVKSDRRAPAYEAMLIKHIECTADGLGIQLFGTALMNWPRLNMYQGADKLPKRMKNDATLHVYTDFEVSASADIQEGFVGIRIGSPASPPDMAGACEDTMGCLGYARISCVGEQGTIARSNPA